MKRTKRSKLLAVLLAITMLMTAMLPTVAFAEDSGSEPPDIITVTITEADMAGISEDSTAIATALTRQGISNATSIAALKVTTEGNAYLSPEDNMYLKENFTSLTYLDESECACSTRNLSEGYLTKSGLPDEKYAEFGGLTEFSSLSTLIIPYEAQIINSYQVNQTGLTKLTIPNTVLVIENGAFSSNTALTSDLIIPDSVVLIGNNAFGAGTSEVVCGKLTLGSSVKYIDNSAFTKRVFSGDLIIPNSVETIGNWVFGAGAFQNGTWTLGTGLRSVGDAAMSNICSGNEGTLFVSSQLVTKDTCFGYNTFSKVVFEKGITAISTRVVRNSKNITTVILPTTLKSIAPQAFISCSALENITLPYGLESIGNGAFEGTKILGIYIPDTVTQIGKVAFENLPQNSVLYAPNDAVYQLLIENNNNQWERRYDNTKTALAVTNGGAFAEDTEFESGKLATPTRKGYIFDGWYDNDSFAGDAVAAVEPGTAYYAKWIPSSGFCGDPAVNDGKDVTWSLDNVTDTLTISGNGAMADYETNVVTGINPSPWCWNRQHISKVVVEEGVTHVGDYAFASFSILNNVELADSIKSIGFKAFHTSGKSSAAGFTIQFPGHLESIKESVFTNSWLAGDIVLPAGLTSIGAYAFKNVAKASSIKTTSKTLYVGVSAFASNGNLNTVDWTSVETLTLPDASEANAAVLFQGCKDTVIYVRDEAIATKIIDLISPAYYSDVHLGTIAVTNGGTFADGTNHVLLELTNPQKADFVFDGWYKDSAFTIPATTVETFKTHYAKWTEKGDQSISYANSTVEKHINGSAFTNELTKTTVDGEITYTSSNTEVAEVDENGEVTIVGAGTATITAAAAETGNYNPAEAKYTLIVTDHIYTDVVTAPTCTDKGYTTHTCSECGDAYKDNYVDATDHSFTSYVSNNDATCTQDGTKTAACDNGCGTTDTITDTGSIKEHNWGEWETVNSPNCTDKGSKNRTCSECGAVETTDVDPNGHDWETGFTIDKAATCTTDGSKSIHCKNCEVVKDSTVIPAIQHSFTNYVSNDDATCTEDGTKTAVCDNGCKTTDTITDADSTIGHSYDGWKSDNTSHWQECSVCGETSEAAAHTFQWITDQEASATDNGSKHEECSVCGYKKAAVEIPATGGTEKPVDNTSGGDNENPSEPSKPDINAPQTGDNRNLWIWIFLMAVSAAGIGATLAISQKRIGCRKTR